MAQTVTECLAAGTDSVTLIDGVKAGTWDVERMEQSEINDMVQRNVDHLELILEYKPVDSDDDTPDVKVQQIVKDYSRCSYCTGRNTY